MGNPLEYAERIAYSSKETLRFSYDMAVKYRKTNGVFLEAGCAAGAQVIAMAKGAPDKIIYALDSFEGLPLPSNRDDQMPGIKMLSPEEQKALPHPGEQVLETTGATSVSVESFREHMQNAKVNIDNIKIVKGWFEHTVPTLAQFTFNIAILRLDGDLYNSTMVCLKHLYPKVIKGGVVIVDDWELRGCRDAVLDYMNDLLIDLPAKVERVSNIAYFFKP